MSVLETVKQNLEPVLQTMREQQPLIHHITNLVVMNDCANMALATGASPVMAHAMEEVEELAAISGALVINIGTLTNSWVESMIRAGKAANRTGVPVVFDPVGAGATRLRTQACRMILEEVKVAVVRANASEAAVLAGLDARVKGVDALTGDGLNAARALARKYNVSAAVTGVKDYVSDGHHTVGIANGDAWMSRLTGTGCMASTVVGCFCAVEGNNLIAAVMALGCYAVAGELAAAQAPAGPMSFKTAFFDTVYHLKAEQILSRLKLWTPAQMESA